MWLHKQRVLFPCVRRCLPLRPKTQGISSHVALLARGQRVNPEQKLLHPEERLGHLKTAEKRVAIFAGISLVIGYFTLKRSFSKMADRQKENAKAALIRPLVVAGPSGSGKSTLLTRLFKEHPDKFGFSVSHTTRKPRPGEVDGKQYHFTTRESMQKGIDSEAFIEWAEYSGNMYGTSKKAVREVQLKGRVCVLDIDMQGVRSLKETDLNSVYVLIRPPSMEVLERRLKGRKTESEESLQKRLAVARKELEYAEGHGVFDHVIINDQLEMAYSDFCKVIEKYIKLQNEES